MLARTFSLGDILTDKEALDLAEIEASCEQKVRASLKSFQSTGARTGEAAVQ